MKEDKITGGLADNHTPESIAKLHGVTVDNINIQLEKGIKVELEHTDDKEIAREIALDHITEMPDYYDKLATIEPAHEGFKLMSLTEYVNEKYYSYADLKSSKARWGGPEDLKDDARITVNRLIPVTEDGRDRVFTVKSIEDQSTDDGIKFEIKLSSKDVIHAFKNGPGSMEWELYLNKKFTTKGDIKAYLVNKLTPLQQYIRAVKIEDWNSLYSDDRRVYNGGNNNNFEDLYKKLSNSDKAKAIKAYIKYGPKGEDKPDIKTFTGS